MAEYVIPHEAEVRAWLRRTRVSDEDIEDLLQEAYCRLTALDAFEQIARPGAYFFSMVRNLLARKLRKSPVVSLETIVEIEAMPDPHATPERAAVARSDFARVNSALATLPERCRKVVELRKFENWSQREVAVSLGVTESVVENDIQMAMRAVLRAWEGLEDDLYPGRSARTKQGRPA